MLVIYLLALRLFVANSLKKVGYNVHKLGYCRKNSLGEQEFPVSGMVGSEIELRNRREVTHEENDMELVSSVISVDFLQFRPSFRSLSTFIVAVAILLLFNDRSASLRRILGFIQT